MPAKRVEVSVGDVYGRLKVVEELPSRKGTSGTKRWLLCRCSCGVETEVRLGHLRSGHTLSCGCFRPARSPGEISPESLANMRGDNYHGMEDSPEYSVWKGIKKRCYYPRSRGYANYGGRGIRLCSGWKSSFKSFHDDMGSRPSPEHQIDRIDGECHYSCGHCEECMENDWESNCRWATRAEQNRNRRDNVWLEFRGDRLCMKDMAEKYGMTKGTLYDRLENEWSLREALLTPVRAWKTDRKFNQVPESERDSEWHRDKARREARATGS